MVLTDHTPERIGSAVGMLAKMTTPDLRATVEALDRDDVEELLIGAVFAISVAHQRGQLS